MQIEDMVDEMVSNEEKELYLCFNITNERFDISKEEHDEVIISIEYDELVKLVSGIYRNILEKKDIKKYESKIIQ